MSNIMTQQLVDEYKKQGYVVLEEVIDLATIAQVKARAAQLVEQLADDGENQIFSTKRNERTRDDYFLDSAEKIACFFEEDAYNDAGQLVQEKHLCINKIAHALHELDPVFKAFSHTPMLASIAEAIGIAQPQIRQSMYIFKQPRIGGEIKWHQDGSFFVTKPHSVVTFWFALEDATLENGCLWVEPGGHNGPLREQFVLRDNCTKMILRDATPWPTEKSALPVPVKAGSLVVFHSHLPHYSGPNHSSCSRQAYTLHVTDGSCDYDSQNWLQAKTLPLRGFMDK